MFCSSHFTAHKGWTNDLMDLSIPIFCDSGNVSAWEQGGMAALPIERRVTWRHYSSYMQVQQLSVSLSEFDGITAIKAMCR